MTEAIIVAALGLVGTLAGSYFANSKFQFPSLREGRRAGDVDAQLRFFISIPAPPRGATA